MKTINPNIFPKDGFFFEESDGARIFAQTWPGVIARVAGYRKRAKLPPGDPAADVITQACNRNPVLCREDDGTTQKQTVRASLKTRVIKWLGSMRAAKDNLQFVDDALARERADVCARCPKNIALPGGCASCKAAVKELRKGILERRFQDGRLNGCEVLGEDLPTLVHLEIPTVDNPELPGACWRRRTL